ncbi:CPA_1a_G0042130.mRNA.1.CDS.1 [Saccharomyces cerevisiae]|nr:CPA_1a_G0042130.mRNA.1.CDS.1 [Saccharomyces cerevisiae]CAI4679029.1 CPI_1c_G0041130.mRNA.1.CDS.1 [Saccharomyces cerevisiae]CAI4690670.1 BBM_1a_G0041370.mRNA.1.CDS.1 [Saccharomyces cerevisiae]CAI7272326.1 BBM_1a_G0041370.mRNA.1.CDS.1 [Saccharomyces cerevisiae]CAI7426382.1 CPI_1c_G0041130.mRNA.1.CDS.1 [Saccharomyces cerevisiae]
MARSLGQSLTATTQKLKGKKNDGKGKNKPSAKIKKTQKEMLYGILNERNIRQIQFGLNKKFSTWYGSAVYFDPETKRLGCSETKGQLSSVSNNQYWLDTLFVCEYCFKYTDDQTRFVGHVASCPFQYRVPGKIKYKSPEYTVRRVKGSKYQLFCQCLCLFTKLYLDNKSMYFKVDHYEFYIVYETGSTKPMGFFSKDLVSYQQNNLACILIFPPYQRRGLGLLLIEFSYKLSQLEGVISGPEVPLSPFGLIGYLKYWSQILCWHLIEGDLAHYDKVTLEDLSIVTGMRVNDVILTLKHLNCIGENNQIYLQSLNSWLKLHGTKRNWFKLKDEYLLIDD